MRMVFLDAGTMGPVSPDPIAAFGMKPVYFSTSGTSHCKEWPSLALDELLREADIVSIHCPLNACASRPT